MEYWFICSYMNNIRDASDEEKSGGYDAKLACHRALMDAFSGLLLYEEPAEMPSWQGQSIPHNSGRVFDCDRLGKSSFQNREQKDEPRVTFFWKERCKRLVWQGINFVQHFLQNVLRTTEDTSEPTLCMSSLVKMDQGHTANSNS